MATNFSVSVWFNSTMDNSLNTIGIFTNETEFFYTQWIYDPSRPKHKQQLNAGYVFLIFMLIVIVFGILKVLIPNGMTQPSVIINEKDNGINQDHYILRHNNKYNKYKNHHQLQQNQTIIYKQPSLRIEPFEELSSSESSVFNENDEDSSSKSESETTEPSQTIIPLPNVVRLETIIE